MDVSENEKCVRLKEICFNLDKQINCSANQTMIKDKCDLFRLSKPNTPTTFATQQTTSFETTVAQETQKTSTKSTPTQTSADESGTEETSKDTTNTLLITSTKSSSTINETISHDHLFTTTQVFDSTTQSSTSAPFTETTITDSSDHFTISTKFHTSESSISSSVSTRPSVTKSTTTTTTKKPHKFFNKPKGIIDYSRFFKHDYGTFNFTKFLYKFDKKKGNSSSQFYDYSKFLSGGNGGNGFNYSQYMNGMFDYSKFMGNNQQSNSSNNDPDDVNKNGYSKFMSQFTGNGTGFDYSKYMGGNGQKKNGEQTKDWGSDKYDYSKYKASGMKSSNSSGSNFYKNDIKSGQQNQDKYAKGNYDYSKYAGGANGGQTGQQSLNLKSANNLDKTKENQKEMGAFDYSKYLKQYTSSKTGSNFDYTKYMKGQGQFFDYSKYANGYQGGGKPNTENSNLIKLTGSRQPTKSFSSWFDYSKYLKPGGHQETDANDENLGKKAKNLDVTKNLNLKQSKPKENFHKASYLNDFTDKIGKFNEERVKQIEKESELNGDKNEIESVDTSLMNTLDSSKENNHLNNEPTLMEKGSENELNQLQTNQAKSENYHHIEMQKQVPQYRKFNKEPSVNVSKIIPNMMTNRYNYTHYGSGVFFINFGTIVNGNNNINGDGNDVGNGNGNHFLSSFINHFSILNYFLQQEMETTTEIHKVMR